MKRLLGIVLLVGSFGTMFPAKDAEISEPSSLKRYGKALAYTGLAGASIWQIVREAPKRNWGPALYNAYFAYFAGSSALESLRGTEEATQDSQEPSRLKILRDGVFGGIAALGVLLVPVCLIQDYKNNKLSRSRVLRNIHLGLVYGWSAKNAFSRVAHEYSKYSSDTEEG